MSALMYGMGTGFSLLLAIGAQNAFILKQGLKKQYVFILCAVCALSDSLLIFFGVAGFSHVITRWPEVVIFAKYGGALFLFVYGLRSFYAAMKSHAVLVPSDIEKEYLWQKVCVCLALTWLNPHVYLDTLVLIGSVSTHFITDKYQFAVGAILASWVFFYVIGYGARILLPLFQRPISWRILDFIVGIVMWVIAVSLITV